MLKVSKLLSIDRLKLSIGIGLLGFSVASANESATVKTETITNSQGEAIEVIEYAGKDSRPSAKSILKPKYGVPARYDVQYLTEQSHNVQISQIQIATLKNPSSGITWSAHEETQPEKFSSQPPAVLIMDSGFFPTHPLLQGKHFIDPATSQTTIRGVLGRYSQLELHYNENELLRMPVKGQGAPYSHGTSVASIAMKDISHTSFLGISGEIFAASFQFKIIDLIKEYDIRFTNLSFGLGDRKGISAIDKGDHEALEHFIRNQSSVLHVIASGNAGIDFDESSYSEYPACHQGVNSVVVSGLATGHLNQNLLHSYKRSSMANHGVRCTDIMAPAEGVPSAWLWPLQAKTSGTSVASPYVLNVLLKMHAKAPYLSAQVFRELLLKTVYVPLQNPFKVRSGGIVHEARALRATELHLEGHSVEEAVWIARTQIKDDFEIQNPDELKTIWQNNRLRF